MNYFNDTIKKIYKYFITFILLILFFVATLLVVNFFSNKNKELNNIKESVSTFFSEGVYPEYMNSNDEYKGQDNYTDALMLNICYALEKNNNLKSIMEMNYYYINDNNFNSIDELAFLENPEKMIKVNYARYWHGYMIYLKPLLNIFNYSQIRIIMFSVLYIIFFVFLFNISKKMGLRAFLVYLFSFLLININDIYMSIQYMNIFMISFFFMIYLTSLDENKLYDNFSYYNFILGNIVCFIDLLTTPIVTIGLSLSYFLLYFTFNSRKKLKEIIIKCSCGILLWGLGYVMTWSAKWIISSIVLKYNVISDAVQQANIRTNTIPDGFSTIDWIKYTLKNNLYYLIEGDKKIGIIFIFIILLILLVIFYHKKFKRIHIGYIIPFILLGSIPYIWYIILLNHSGIHAFFVYRNQIIMSIAILSITIYSIDLKKLAIDILKE